MIMVHKDRRIEFRSQGFKQSQSRGKIVNQKANTQDIQCLQLVKIGVNFCVQSPYKHKVGNFGVVPCNIITAHNIFCVSNYFYVIVQGVTVTGGGSVSACGAGGDGADGTVILGGKKCEMC